MTAPAKPDPLGIPCPCFSCCAPIGYNCRNSAWGRDQLGGWIRKYTTRDRPHAARVRAAREREEKAK